MIDTTQLTQLISAFRVDTENECKVMYKVNSEKC